MIENGGIKYKMLMNDMVHSRPTINSSSTDLVTRDSNTDLSTKKNDLEQIESLMTLIQASKNRKEKRRLMAEYNQKQELIWGQARSVSAL